METSGRLSEGAVAAAVAAQHRQRDEHLGGVGDASTPGGVAHCAGASGQLGEGHVEHERESTVAGRSRAAAGSAIQTTLSARIRVAGQVSSSAMTRARASPFSSPDTVTITRRARAMPEKVRVMRSCGLRPVGSTLVVTRRPGSASSAGELGEQRCGVAVVPETEVHDVEPAQLAQAQLVGVGPVLAPHGVVGVHRPDTLEQRLSHEPVVRIDVVEWQTALVAPVEVDLPPVDLGAGVVGEPLIAAARSVATGAREREGVVGPAVEGLDDAFGELAGDVVGDDQVSEHSGFPCRAGRPCRSVRPSARRRTC